jgi:hypothetical protein
MNSLSRIFIRFTHSDKARDIVNFSFHSIAIGVCRSTHSTSIRVFVFDLNEGNFCYGYSLLALVAKHKTQSFAFTSVHIEMVKRFVM